MHRLKIIDILYLSNTHSPTLPSFHLRHSSFSNLSFSSPTSQLFLQPFHRFTYVTAHSPTLPLLYLRHSSFSNPSFASPMSHAFHLIHSAHSSTFASLHLHLNSFSNPSIALPTSQLILQPFRCFTYVTVHSPTLHSRLLRHKLLIHLASRPCNGPELGRLRTSTDEISVKLVADALREARRAAREELSRATGAKPSQEKWTRTDLSCSWLNHLFSMTMFPVHRKIL